MSRAVNVWAPPSRMSAAGGSDCAAVSAIRLRRLCRPNSWADAHPLSRFYAHSGHRCPSAEFSPIDVERGEGRPPPTGNRHAPDKVDLGAACRYSPPKGRCSDCCRTSRHILRSPKLCSPIACGRLWRPHPSSVNTCSQTCDSKQNQSFRPQAVHRRAVGPRTSISRKLKLIDTGGSGVEKSLPFPGLPEALSGILRSGRACHSSELG